MDNSSFEIYAKTIEEFKKIGLTAIQLKKAEKIMSELLIVKPIKEGNFIGPELSLSDLADRLGSRQFFDSSLYRVNLFSRRDNVFADLLWQDVADFEDIFKINVQRSSSRSSFVRRAI